MVITHLRSHRCPYFLIRYYNIQCSLYICNKMKSVDVKIYLIHRQPRNGTQR